MDRSLIAMLYQQALSEGEDRSWLNDIFGRTSEKGIIQHERRHKDHLHVRFYNPRAQEHGRIVYPVLVETGAAPPPMVKHRVRRGETLGSLARRYGTSVSAIRAANGLRARGCGRAAATRSRSVEHRPTAARSWSRPAGCRPRCWRASSLRRPPAPPRPTLPRPSSAEPPGPLTASPRAD